MRNACELKIFSHVKICRYFISHAKSNITHVTCMRNACELKIFSHVKICRYFISHAKSHITHATHTRNACEMQNIFACENWGSCVKYCRSHAKTQIITCDILARSHATSHTNAIETNLTVRMWTACERHLFTCKKKPVTCKKIIPPDVTPWINSVSTLGCLLEVDYE